MMIIVDALFLILHYNFGVFTSTESKKDPDNPVYIQATGWVAIRFIYKLIEFAMLIALMVKGFQIY